MSNSHLLVILFMTCVCTVLSLDYEESSTDVAIEITTLIPETTTDVQETDNEDIDASGIWSIALDIVGAVTNWLVDDGNGAEGGRTFGKIRRLKMALIPLLFKFGVISAMVTALLFMVMKVIFLLKTLIVLNIGGFLAKFLTLKSAYQPQWNYPHGWSSGPASIETWPKPELQQHKEIHVHIHNSGSGGNPEVWKTSNEPYGSYSNYSPNYLAVPQKFIPTSQH